MDVGVSVIDRFTYYTLDFMEGIKQDSTASLSDLVRSIDLSRITVVRVPIHAPLVLPVQLQRSGCAHRL